MFAKSISLHTGGMLEPFNQGSKGTNFHSVPSILYLISILYQNVHIHSEFPLPVAVLADVNFPSISCLKKSVASEVCNSSLDEACSDVWNINQDSGLSSHEMYVLALTICRRLPYACHATEISWREIKLAIIIRRKIHPLQILVQVHCMMKLVVNTTFVMKDLKS